jgi:hypothetical protein
MIYRFISAKSGYIAHRAKQASNPASKTVRRTMNSERTNSRAPQLIVALVFRDTLKLNSVNLSD